VQGKLGGKVTAWKRIAVGEILERAGVVLNGPKPWDIQVKDIRFHGRVLRDKSLGLGESYMEGWWSCERIDEMVSRLLGAGMDTAYRDKAALLLTTVLDRVVNRQSRHKAMRVAKGHYDIGNDLFFAFLDPLLQYSCAYFDGTDDLSEAQRLKCELICRKLDLRPGDRLLDIGCGWGGLARYAAEHYGCEVTGINISREQVAYAREWCVGLPVRIVESDYRDLRGRYEKIVSVGMFEHVGHRNYRTFMETVSRCLDKDGIFLLHTIGSNVSMRDVDPWFGKYIFPGGMLPSLSQISAAAEGLFGLEDIHNLGLHYEKTLLAWHRNFLKSWDAEEGLRRKGEAFRRMWEYYLLSSAGAFRSRSNQLWQLVYTVPGRPQPRCRIC
jgi:cyclopropane-fatty-acyl-phospholipid synthase